jgi:hypothetical protein
MPPLPPIEGAAFVTVDLNWYLPKLAELAGTTIDQCSVANDDQFYAPVSQEALDNAKAQYSANADGYLSDAQWANVRKTRDKKLYECDWTQVPDVALTAEEVAEWRTYRQELRQIPETQTDPTNIIWPTEPSSTP